MAASTYEIERRAREEGEVTTEIQHLRIAVGELTRDVRALMWVLLPVSFTGLIVGLLALIIVLARP